MALLADSARTDLDVADVARLLDEAAFQRLYADASRPLWSYLYRVLGDASEAEDLVQEAFLRILRAPVAELEPEAQRAYLFRTASHLAVDRFRSGSRQAALVEALGHERPDHVAAAPADVDLARRFAELKPQERALLWMAYVEGAAHEEIAMSLRVKPGSVKVLLFRARKRLRDLLGRAAGARR